MKLAGSIEIERPIDEVFVFVADATNDPAWCERVRWCRQAKGDAPAVGTRYEAMHKPSGYPFAHIRSIEVLEHDPPRFVRWRQVDHLATFDIAYELELTPNGTRLIQRDEIRWRLPGMGAIGGRIVGRHIGQQHLELKRLLEVQAG